MHRHSYPRRLPVERGFTLIELMVAIAILGILLSLGAPSFRDFLVSNRLTSDINGFIGLINYARSEAITRNQSVIICPKNNSNISCQASQFWGQFETQMFVDINGNGDRDANDLLLKTLPALDATALERGFVRSSVGVITFRSSGYSNTAQSFDMWTIKTGDTDYEFRFGRTICVSSPGRTRVISYGSNCTNF